MQGIALCDLVHPLYKVSAHKQAKPADQIKNLSDRLHAGVQTYRGHDRYEDDIVKNYYRLPLPCFADFSFDELCKLKYSSSVMMDGSVYRLFETDANEYRVVEKIRNSMWRWGCGRNVWNEVVDAYNGIRHFSLGLGPEFEIRLDYTTGNNPFGFAEHSRSFLDGTFGFLVYYRGKYVITIGFSIMSGRKLLLQQVQLKEAHGNRFLYQFPSPYLPYIIGRIKAAFPGHSINLVDGQDLVNKTEKDYQQALDTAQRSDWNRDERVAKLLTCLDHIRSDSKRITAFYQTITPFTFTGKSRRANNLRHYEIV
jgi:hypothetical protein